MERGDSAIGSHAGLTRYHFVRGLDLFCIFAARCGADSIQAVEATVTVPRAIGELYSEHRE